jgi:hypothetical protein
MENAVGPRQKRRRIAAAVALSIAQCDDGCEETAASGSAFGIEYVEEGDRFEGNEANHGDFNLIDNEIESADFSMSVNNVLDFSDFWANFDSQGEPESSDSDDESNYLSCCDEREWDFVDENETIEVPTFREKLASWVTECQIPQVHVDKLLTILKDTATDFRDLPSTCRTLLDTPTSTPVVKIPPGNYYHFGLKNGILNMLRTLKVVSFLGFVIQLIVNVDGLPIAKSSGSQLWPILAKIKNIALSKPFIVGLYHGDAKPCDSNQYLEAFVEELLLLTANGIDWNGQHLAVELFCFVCDAPAKACMTCIKLHSGYFSCSRCCVEGDWHGRVVFLEDSPKRTDESFRSKEQPEHHNGVSILERLDINMIECFSLDYMHLVCLGVMRKLLWTWIRGSLFVGGRRIRLGWRNIILISARLLALVENISCDFARKPRSLKELARWKATELRQFLLYTGPIVLKGILDEDLYNHFMLLHVAIKILVDKELCEQYSAYARDLIVLFVQQCEEYYGKEFISYNVHNLLHLTDDVVRNGPLDGFALFDFENLLQEVKGHLRKHDKPLQQIIRRLVERERNLLLPSAQEANQTCLKQKHSSGPVIGQDEVVQFHFLQYKSWTFRCNNTSDGWVMLSDNKLVKVLNFVQSPSGISIIGKRFTSPTNLFTIPIGSSSLGIYLTGSFSTTLQSWSIDLIKCKLLVLPLPEKQNSFAIFPLWQYSKDP